MTPLKLAQYFDHTLLKSDFRESEVLELCLEAQKNSFFSVCIPPNIVKLASEKLKDTPVKLTTVVGFPFGYNTSYSKKTECEEALALGADEIDMVINLSWIKDSSLKKAEREVSEIKKICKKNTLKVIIESSNLSPEEIINASNVIVEAGADFVKTSTGFGKSGAKTEDVQLIKNTIKEQCKIKASGGIRSWQQCKELINAGADRIGASSSVKILNEFKSGAL